MYDRSGQRSESSIPGILIMIRIMLAAAMVSGMILSACSVSRSAESRIVEQKTDVGNQPAAAVKKARIYRMSGNSSA